MTRAKQAEKIINKHSKRQFYNFNSSQFAEWSYIFCMLYEKSFSKLMKIVLKHDQGEFKERQKAKNKKANKEKAKEHPPSVEYTGCHCPV